ncbi:UDP-glucose/GDP-mannose dehydrogenase family protein [Streptomyces sp. NPDC048420]|uniref:UDP-glucose dehydrogenase family protein n=1 Tax=Streptomyces sp. NPDC048420 TaxID=3155755 RepID=UPI00344823E5
MGASVRKPGGISLAWGPVPRSSAPCRARRDAPREKDRLTMKRSVAVFGAGYIGLVTGACLAELGHTVTVRDIVPERIQRLNEGGVPIYEPELGDMIARNKERLAFTLDADEAVREAEIVYVCVDTPPTPSGDADLSRVFAVIDVLKSASHLAAVVVKSTVPVGTGQRIRQALDEADLEHVGYASNPEFTAEGKAVRDFMHPDRVVVGTWDDDTAKLIAELHDGVDGKVVFMDVPSAELTKLGANAALATKISLVNELATVCEATGADISHVAAAIGMDPRIGSHFMKAGLGYGGSCFPKDSRALRALSTNNGYPFQLLTSVIEVNELQPRRHVQRLKDELGGLRGRTVALLGMTFKPCTDDMREAPSVIIAGRLLAEGAIVRCWDPMAQPGPVEPWTSTTRHETPLAALEGADAAIIVTEWLELAEVPWGRAHTVMRTPLILDGRNLLDPQVMAGLGFTYMSVGRPTVSS